MSSLQELQDKVADLQKQNEILGGYLNDPNEQKDEIEFQASGMENEMLADYLQRDAERTLHGVKTVETRNWPMLKDTSGPCLLHIGYKTMDESAAWEFLWRNDLADSKDLERLLSPPPGLQRGQVLGLLDLEKTYQYSEEEMRLPDVQKSVVSEVVGKWATPIRRAWWLKSPLRAQGRPGIWKLRLPRAAVPEDALRVLGWRASQRDDSEQQLAESSEDIQDLPRLMVFDLDGVCWSPEMYQTIGGSPYRRISDGVVRNSAGEEIRLFPAVQRVWSLLYSLRSLGVRVAVASSSRRHKALPLLETMEVSSGISMMDVVDRRLFEMYYRRGEYKRPHLEALLSKSGVAPTEVLFVDDSAKNIESVRSLGIAAVHLPDGLSEESWSRSLDLYKSIQGQHA
ncbi:Magnesium-dependent phosphatase 1 (MDP-1) [Durusdinium trenchii]|uniref:Magnesium-dependent phosphatase 1 (MDP-1) n=1 Tax=Durusdinium trenchii TaxID=1381693 RepID=A0ABP0I7L3_9DINO